MSFPTDGVCDPAFARLREAFAQNFADRGEPGAAVAVSVKGRKVADLWGGWADAERTRPWQRDTLVNFFSVSKALCAIAALRLVEQSRIALDAPAAHVWPEFAQGGKDAVSLRQILSHRAGLPALREKLPEGAALHWPLMTQALARQEPWWQPGTAHGYHVNTFGFLIGEIVRRIEGRTIGKVLREDIAGPLDADVHIGLPGSEHARVAEFLWPAVSRSEAMPGPDQAMRYNAYWNPPGISGAGWVNRPEWRRAEIPSTNGHGTARGVARIYEMLAAGGAIGTLCILAADTIAQACEEHSSGFDLINERPSRFGLGFQLTQPERPLGPNRGAFGHFGAGGSLGFCDPESGVAFGYVTNDMGPRWQNPRNKALIDAVYASL
ncbi:MAG: beta-lactamase family protein [Alphaproteobacteria bacterium]|nr:beta-lactamase family protein [Alphaproteobacteria bacterium]